MKLTTAFVLMALLPAAGFAQGGGAGQVVGPSCTYSGAPGCRGTINGASYGQDVTSPSGSQRDWWADRQGAFAEVTKTNPRAGYGGYNSGSLELRVQGQTASPGSDEWGFWYRFAGGASYENALSSSYGTLKDLSSLSFDWFRQGDGSSLSTNPSEDWPFKTPVLRLRLLEEVNGQQFQSELVWEGWYNRATEFNNNPTPLNTWVTSDNMQTDKFWYARPPGQGVDPVVSSGGSCGLIGQSGWSGGISAFTLAEFTGGEVPCINGNTKITGIAVGIGSRWPLPYVGFVDNVRMGFTTDGQYRQAVDVNFDFVPTSTVPEPSTWALMGAGLVALGVAARRRKPKA